MSGTWGRICELGGSGGGCITPIPSQRAAIQIRQHDLD